MVLFASGDSITVGANVSAGQRYVNILADELEATVSSFAVGGEQAADQSKRSQTAALSSDDKAVILIGTNDHRIYDLSIAKREHYRNFLRRLIGNYVQPQRVSARSTVRTGTWGNSDSLTGMHSGANGSTMTATVSGRYVSIGYIIHDYAACVGGVAKVYVDGVCAGSYSCDGYTDHMETSHGGKWGCAQFNHDTGVDGPHEVQIVNDSPNRTRIYVDDIRGSDQPFSPRVVVGTIPPCTAAAYINSGSSEANVVAYNIVVAEVVAEFAGMGFNVGMADVFSALDTATDFSDGVHPNAAGQAKIAAAFLPHLKMPYTKTFPLLVGGMLAVNFDSNDLVTSYGVTP